MIRRAPATRAPCTALMPTPPTPSTATVSPGLTPARLTAEPNPVATPQETSATAGHGMSGSTLTTEDSASSCRSANAPSCENRATGSSPIRCAMRPSVIIPVSKSFMPMSQRNARPARQDAHEPHEGMNAGATWSPGATDVTVSPTCETSPAPSWPQITG
jgi:hypothetical protein